MKTIAVSTLFASCLLTPTAGADALLFPVLTRSPSVATIVSVVNKDPEGVLNVNYFTKPNDFNTPCQDGSTTQIVNGGRPNDMITFDASGNFAPPNGGPLFNDPATFVPYAADFTMPGTGVNRAVLIVDDGDDDTEVGSSDLYGEAIFLEIDGGAAWGYRAYNSIDDNGPGGPIFGGANDNLGEVLEQGTGTGNAAVTLLPPDEWTTRFFVTPVADGFGAAASQRDCETCSVSIYMSSDKAGTRVGMFDRDTTARDAAFGTPLPLEAKNVVCTAGVGLTDILPQATINAITDQGGWGYVQIREGTSGNQEDSAVVIKLEFNLTDQGATTLLSPDTGKTFQGTVNSAVWLRNKTNVLGVDGF